MDDCENKHLLLQESQLRRRLTHLNRKLEADWESFLENLPRLQISSGTERRSYLQAACRHPPPNQASDAVVTKSPVIGAVAKKQDPTSILIIGNLQRLRRMQRSLDEDLVEAEPSSANLDYRPPPSPPSSKKRSRPNPGFLTLPEPFNLQPYMNLIGRYIADQDRRWLQVLGSHESDEIVHGLTYYLHNRYITLVDPDQPTPIVSRSYFNLASRINAAVHDHHITDTRRRRRILFRDRFAIVYPFIVAHAIRHYFLDLFGKQLPDLKSKEFTIQIETDLDHFFNGMRRSEESLAHARTLAFTKEYDNRMNGVSSEGLQDPDTAQETESAGGCRDLHWGGSGRPNHLTRSSSAIQIGIRHPPRVKFNAAGHSPIMTAFAGRIPGRLVYLNHSDSFSGQRSWLSGEVKARLDSLHVQCETLRRSMSEARLNHRSIPAPSPSIRSSAPRSALAAATCLGLNPNPSYPIMMDASTGQSIQIDR